MTVATSWISKKPERCGGDACVRDTRITVWGLVAYARLGLSDDRILKAVQGLTADDLPQPGTRISTARRSGKPAAAEAWAAGSSGH